jgi:hypothetical protein
VLRCRCRAVLAEVLQIIGGACRGGAQMQRYRNAEMVVVVVQCKCRGAEVVQKYRDAEV